MRHNFRTGLIVWCLVVLMTGLPAAKQVGNAPLPALKHPIAVIAHRGGASLAPENTLAAIRRAIKLRVDYVELDVRITKDGHLVLIHDSTLDRTTNGSGQVREMTLNELRRLDAGSKFHPKYRKEKIPTFEEALELCKGKVHIYVDHKEAPIEKVIEEILKHQMQNSVIVYSNPNRLMEWKRQQPNIPVMPSLPTGFRRLGGITEFQKVYKVEALNGNLVEWSKELVAESQSIGMKVYVDNLGPNDNIEGFRKAIAMGVDGIQTDYPDLLIKFLKKEVKKK